MSRRTTPLSWDCRFPINPETVPKPTATAQYVPVVIEFREAFAHLARGGHHHCPTSSVHEGGSNDGNTFRNNARHSTTPAGRRRVENNADSRATGENRSGMDRGRDPRVTNIHRGASR